MDGTSDSKQTDLSGGLVTATRIGGERVGENDALEVLTNLLSQLKKRRAIDVSIDMLGGRLFVTGAGDVCSLQVDFSKDGDGVIIGEACFVELSDGIEGAEQAAAIVESVVEHGASEVVRIRKGGSVTSSRVSTGDGFTYTWSQGLPRLTDTKRARRYVPYPVLD